MANKLRYLEILTTDEGNTKALSILITLTPRATLAPLVPPRAQLLNLQTVANANQTPKNLTMFETRTKSFSKSTVCAQVTLMTQCSMRY
jgi:hypothetical protein